MDKPAWVSEGSIRKYDRALAQLTKDKQPITEAAVKELYVKWGGLVIGEAATLVGVPEGHPIIEAHEEEGAAVAANPKTVRGGKK